jgi:hypothetical protein
MSASHLAGQPQRDGIATTTDSLLLRDKVYPNGIDHHTGMTDTTGANRYDNSNGVDVKISLE